jgi:hypothetical protein
MWPIALATADVLFGTTFHPPALARRATKSDIFILEGERVNGKKSSTRD